MVKLIELFDVSRFMWLIIYILFLFLFLFVLQELMMVVVDLLGKRLAFEIFLYDSHGFVEVPCLAG